MERRFQRRVSGNWTLTSPMSMLGVGGVVEGWEEVSDREESLPLSGSDSSRTVGDTACEMALRLEESEEDMRWSMRLALLVFFSFSSLVDEKELAVGGGDRASLGVRLPVERRLLTEPDLLCIGDDAWVEGGREGDIIEPGREEDLTFGDESDDTNSIDWRRSAKDCRPSLIRSLTIEMDDLRFLAVVLVALEEEESLLSFESLLS
jgi:hypothetical protein